jgi:GNAT superfamily N-acetyltransferase
VSTWEIRPTRFGAPVAQHLLDAAMAELATRYGGDGDGNPIDPLEFDPPEGAFLVAWRDGEPVGCGGWRRVGSETGLPEDVAEIKRMYVTPAARGNGLAKAILTALEDSARDAGRKRVVLETGDRQPEAIALYDRVGYERIPNYGYYRDAPGCVSFGRSL